MSAEVPEAASAEEQKVSVRDGPVDLREPDMAGAVAAGLRERGLREAGLKEPSAGGCLATPHEAVGSSRNQGPGGLDT